MTYKSDLAKIHIGKKELGMSDDAYRAMLVRLTGKQSLRDSSPLDRAKVLAEMQQKGFKAKRGTRKNDDWRSARIRKIYAQWSELDRLGELRDKSPQACLSFCQQHMKAEKLEWAETQELNACIEALKSWIERAGG